jgi:hypothetical protein
MVYFQTKNPNLGNFWRVLQWKMVYILWIFGIFYWYFVCFSPFSYVVPTKKNQATLVSVLRSEQACRSNVMPISSLWGLDRATFIFYPVNGLSSRAGTTIIIKVGLKLFGSQHFVHLFRGNFSHKNAEENFPRKKLKIIFFPGSSYKNSAENFVQKIDPWRVQLKNECM